MTSEFPPEDLERFQMGLTLGGIAMEVQAVSARRAVIEAIRHQFEARGVGFPGLIAVEAAGSIFSTEILAMCNEPGEPEERALTKVAVLTALALDLSLAEYVAMIFRETHMAETQMMCAEPNLDDEAAVEEFILNGWEEEDELPEWNGQTCGQDVGFNAQCGDPAVIQIEGIWYCAEHGQRVQALILMAAERDDDEG